jgi:hypothetical protein
MPNPFTKKRLSLFIALAIMIAGATYLASPSRNPVNPLYAQPRIDWKNHAISLIQQRAADPAWIAAQTARLQAATATRPFAHWIADEFLLMKNGDWIICQSVSRKEPDHIQDLFIGLGSNGQWYYSTFHFDIDKAALQIEGTQPASLLQFADAYSLRPFDGHSNDSLQSTWTPGFPYGVDYFQNAEKP